MVGLSFDARVGSTICGRYKLEGVVATGGFGTVYRATQLSIGRTVALKVVANKAADDPAGTERVERAVRALGRVDNPNVIALVDAGRTEDGHAFVVTEFIKGIELADVLTRDGLLTPTRVARLAVQLCEGLAACHALGIVHCDIKPENLLVSTRGMRHPVEHLTIFDFGIASIAGDPTEDRVTGMTVGSPHYMSPEQCRAKVPTVHSDIYSVGATLYELLTGRPPFDANDTAELMLKQVHEVAPPLPASVDQRLATLVLSCLSKRPVDRPGSALALAERFDALAASVGNAPRPRGPRTKQRVRVPSQLQRSPFSAGR